MAICNKSCETLRALELTKDQFISVIETPCPAEEGSGKRSAKGQDKEVLGYTFTDKDKELCESFKKVYQLGLNQLRIFVTDLKRDNTQINEQGALYYIRQLYNGPFTNQVAIYAENPYRGLGKEQNCFFPSPDILGCLADTSQQNAGTAIYYGESNDISLNLTKKTPAFIRRNLYTCQRACANVFNYNAESAVFSDNTLPYIDKRSIERVNTEHLGEYTSSTIAVGNLMLKDIKFSKILRGIANAIIGIIEDYLGIDAFRLFEYKRNINFFDPKQNISKTKNEKVCKSFLILKKAFDEQGNEYIDEECVEVCCSCCCGPSIPNFGLTISTSEGSFDLYTVAGQGGTGVKPRENANIGGTQMSPQVDPALEGLGQFPGVLNVTTFTNPQSAAQKTLELTNGALSGAHTHSTSTGGKVWMPFDTMEEFQKYLDRGKDICADEDSCSDKLSF
tara:strand:- start:94 stop:1440 length:1347 start_codon:yes stop_codon:yes gene_type:complete